MPQAAVRAAMAAGVKPAALTTHEPSLPPASAGTGISVASPALKTVAERRRAAKSHHRKPALKKINTQAKAATGPAITPSGSNAKVSTTVPGTNAVTPVTGDAGKTSNKPSAGIPKGQ